MRQIADKDYTCDRCKKPIFKGIEMQVDGRYTDKRLHPTCFFTVTKQFNVKSRQIGITNLMLKQLR